MSGSPEFPASACGRSETRESAREKFAPGLPSISPVEKFLPIEEDLKTDEIAARQRCRLGNRLLLPRLGVGDAANCQENCDGGAELSGTEPHAGRNCTTHTGLRWRFVTRRAPFRAAASAPRSVADRLDDRFHVAQVFLERAPAGGGQPVLRARHAAVERLRGRRCTAASSSLRAWTLRLPSVVCSSRLRSLNVSRSLTASALTMPRRRRSWMSRSSSSGLRFAWRVDACLSPSDLRLLA